LFVLNFKELIGMGKFDEQIGDIFGDVEIRPPQVFGKTFFRQRPKQLTEWMAARNGASHLDLPGDPCPLHTV
jgi:hypothetical protein